jgi:RNA polymerase sigma-70 factor, ECF subfamily
VEEHALLEGLRRGEEGAFVALLDRYGASLLRLARFYLASPAVAEEVVQEALLGLLEGLPRFEGRSSLKTWLFRILINRAKTRAQREGRSIPFSSAGLEEEEPALSPERFLPRDHRWAGHWAVAPRPWAESPERLLLLAEVRTRLQAALGALPPAQREVITLRDIEGWSSEEVCNVLELSETNQRVLLHRARARLRNALEGYLQGEDA